MTTDSQGRSARIYQFPVRSVARVAEERSKSVMEVLAMRYPATASGSGWYHEAAIQEAELAVKQ